MKDYNVTGVVSLVGAIIKQAILDYNKCPPRSHDYTTAEYFLFYPNKLEAFLDTFSCYGILNCDFVRRIAKNKRLFREYFVKTDYWYKGRGHERDKV